MHPKRRRHLVRYGLMITLPSLLCAILVGFCGETRGFYVGKAPLVHQIITLDSMAACIDPTVENWRNLPIPKLEDSTQYQKNLSERSTWSDIAYQESLELYERLIQCNDTYISGPVKTALCCLDHAFRLYGPLSVICSFNGGKDAVVILHLVRAAYATYCKQQDIETIQRPRTIYFDHADEFPEILSFLHDQVVKLDLDMISFEKGTKFQDGLKVIVDSNCVINARNQPVKFPVACVLGTRLSDPNAAGQQQFAPSSHYMPPFMRVNPVLDWTYGHVWHFLRLFQLEYCTLYDQGYTSLGTTKDTLPCPALANEDENSSTDLNPMPKFSPAYMLRDWSLERAGRISKEKKMPIVSAVETEEPLSYPQSVSSSSSIGQLSTMSDGRAMIPKVTSQQFDVSSSRNGTNDYDGGDVSWGTFAGDVESQKTAALLIIGDEILKGFTSDKNTQVAAMALRDNNVVLKYVIVVSDVLEEIVSEIRRIQALVDVLITSGGVGGTHDDVTIESVAVALGCGLVQHEEMAMLLLKKMNKTDDTAALSEAQIKMATLPTNAKLRYLSKDPNDWPILQCKNIFILPGIPEFFSKKIRNVAEYLAFQLERLPSYKVVLKVDENSIVPILNQVVQKHPKISFGSYPFVNHPDHKTVITIEGRVASRGRRNSDFVAGGRIVPFNVSNRRHSDSALNNLDAPTDNRTSNITKMDVQLALDDLISQLPKDSVLRVDVDDMSLFD